MLVNARAAADQLGATPMDRPDWVAVHPRTREVYVTLTNNDQRGDKIPVDKANPRPQNLHGQILRWNEDGGDPAATHFEWDVFLLAGEAEGSRDTDGNPVPAHLTGTINGDRFSSPDGLAFDADGRLWIQTDYGDDEPAMQAMGTNQLLCADPSTREVRRFLVGPRGLRDYRHHLEPGLPGNVGQCAASRAELPGQRRQNSAAVLDSSGHTGRRGCNRCLSAFRVSDSTDAA